jgi:hypothetical protein
MSNFSLFWRPENDYCPVVKTTIPGQLVSCQLLLDFLATLKFDSSRVIRPSDQGYLAFIELLLSILAA